MANCSRRYEGENAEMFGKPLPWIGMYVALASLACTVAMSVDLIRSVKWKKLWVASTFFSFNATTLTLLGVATKMPSDITGSMPGLVDQLTKMTGVNLICVSMNHAMPSLGVMDDVTILSNVVALGILVITMFVNIQIQINTGLITYFSYQNRVYSIVMLLMYAIIVSHSLTVTTTKKLLEKQYNSKHEEILREVDSHVADTRYSIARLAEYIAKYWLMALTSSPDYALRSSGMSLVSAILCWNMTAWFSIRSLLSVYRSGEKGCYVRSDYKWSAVIVFVIQTVGILVGTVASLLRVGFSTSFGFIHFRSLFYFEEYRFQKLHDWRKAPLPFNISNRGAWRVVLDLKNLVVIFLIVLQAMVIFTSKLFLILLSLPWFIFFLSLDWVNSVQTEGETATRSNPDMSSYVLPDMSSYVLHLEGEGEDPTVTAGRWKDYPQQWIESGRGKQPDQLLDLLRRSSIVSNGFSRVSGLINDNVHLLPSEAELPNNNWALHLVTLTCVLRAAFRGSQYEERVKSLMDIVNGSLRYVKLVDANIRTRGSVMMSKAANMVWETVLLRQKWLDVHLDRFAATDSDGIIRELKNTAQALYDRCDNKSAPLDWPPEVVAANCMFRITATILQKGDRSYGQLQGTVVDLIGACLTNLPRAIFTHCSGGKFGAREVRVREAALMLGETEAILQFLEEPGRMNSYPAGKEKLEMWIRRNSDHV